MISFARTLPHWVEALKNAFLEARRKRQIYLTTHTELSAMSDRDLTDLGIARADIPRLASEARRAAA